MSSIENHFIKQGENAYTSKSRSIAFAIFCGAGLILISWAATPILLSGDFDFAFMFGLFGYLIIFGMFFALIAMALFTTTTEINLNTRQIKLKTRNIFNVRHEHVSSIDNVRISSITMGITDATPKETYIVKAGILELYESGEKLDVSIFSKETTDISERNKIMLELYAFFFPDRKAVSEKNFITNGTATYLLSDSEKLDFELEMKEEKEREKRGPSGPRIDVDLT